MDLNSGPRPSGTLGRGGPPGALTQVAAVVGNVGMVVPTVLALERCALAGQWGAHDQPCRGGLRVQGRPGLLSPGALLLRPHRCLLFISSLIAGWAENWLCSNGSTRPCAIQPAHHGLACVSAPLLAWASCAKTSRLCGQHFLAFAARPGATGVGLQPPSWRRHVTLVVGQLVAAAASYGLRPCACCNCGGAWRPSPQIACL